MTDKDENDVLLAASADRKSDWVLDSGSAYHLCREREVFSTYAACDKHIWMVNNTTSRVVGKGSVRFCMEDKKSVNLTKVRHVPNLRKNLISIGMLDLKGCISDASGGTLRIFKENKKMLWGKKTEGLYRLEGSVQVRGATVRHESSGISEKNGQGKQLLHIGTQNKRRACVRKLLGWKPSLTKEADKLRRKTAKDTALHLAALHGKVEAMEELLSHCPDCWEMVNDRGQNILHIAIEYEKVNVISCILKRQWIGNLLNQKDNEGNTPLHMLAASTCFHLVLNQLICHPLADKCAFNKENLTPRDIATSVDSFRLYEVSCQL
ncbi:hypothetical protein Acr_03g0017720 [Actinidia rufa]|uniref:Retrovirus-related Pol polyprotein from transposon TNT 1-94-like beta-barrel domain-containing protein n=1 Tax=Actinidia rufa TaxID=165716 RepID=A0A7J0EER4_9ERIC|nr:hypothetical protein Acr_03g0017720 [Actinidia rufa]